MAQTADTLTFEQALERLEVAVRELESTDTGLDQALARYEEGVHLLKRCRTILDEAERKIRLLTGVDANGQPITQDFDATPTAERDGGAGRELPDKAARNTRRTASRAVSEPTGEGGNLF